MMENSMAGSSLSDRPALHATKRQALMIFFGCMFLVLSLISFGLSALPPRTHWSLPVLYFLALPLIWWLWNFQSKLPHPLRSAHGQGSMALKGWGRLLLALASGVLLWFFITNFRWGSEGLTDTLIYSVALSACLIVILGQRWFIGVVPALLCGALLSWLGIEEEMGSALLHFTIGFAMLLGGWFSPGRT